MPIVTVPISQQPLGAVATNAALAAIDVSTIGENAVVTTLGGQTVGDGLGRTFYFAAASARTIDSGAGVLSTSSSGRWIATDAFSGVGPATASLTGYGETFALMSGFVPCVYALPPSQSVIGKIITVKDITTGTLTVRCATPGDLIVDNGGATAAAAVASVVTTLTGGQTFNFIAPYSGRFYRIDKVV